MMEDINPTDFKTDGCAEFVYGQIQIKIEDDVKQLQHILTLKRWYDLAEKEGYTQLSTFLYSYYTSQKKDYESRGNRIAALMEIVNQAVEVDKKDSESSGIGGVPT